MRSLVALLLGIEFAVASAFAGGPQGVSYDSVRTQLLEAGMGKCESYEILRQLVTAAPHRLAGSPGAEKAVAVTRQMMLDRGFENVHAESIMVPHWVRGLVEKASITRSRKHKGTPLIICALGGSIGTPKSGIEAGVLEVRTFEELQALGPKASGKIIFFNRPFDPSKVNTFEGYGGAVNQRSRGAIEAAKVGGVAVLVRSMTTRLDDVPHTGVMSYVDSIRKVPAAAVSTLDAEMLSSALRVDPNLQVRITLRCETLPDVPSANMMGEITGSEKPNEIIVVGGHIDCWDKGQGAHDDGAGCAQAIEVVHLIKQLGLKPKRTIRAVMFMNEENGTRGGKAYPHARERAGEKHIAAIESDEGGFVPRGFSVDADSAVLARVRSWAKYFEPLNAGDIRPGGSGVDVHPTVQTGVPGFGLNVDPQRYFDCHHSDNDTIDKVHPRELELGAVSLALLTYLISEEGF
jgi:carboxypeptidase Q